MIILEKPYVSDFLIKTIKKNKFSVLSNSVAEGIFEKTELISSKQAISLFNNELIYTNSENSLEWISKNLTGSNLLDMINLSKDKVLFRKALSKIFPNYFFKELSSAEIKNVDAENLPYPLVLKPAVGFLSFGVFTIQNVNEWNEIILKLDEEIEKFAGIFPENVVNTNKFIIEKLIDGEEFAIDGYFDEKSEATVLNIYKHPFYNGKDVSDRVYYTSKDIILNTYPVFKDLLDKIGKVCNFKNFPFHLELRYDGKSVIPIELNPMRFCGWCITDISYYAWGINVYECFFNKQTPDWNNILKDKDNSLYYFTIGDIPGCIKRENIYKIDYEMYLKNISNPIVVRAIDYKVNPIFSIIFAKTENYQEISNLLSLDMSEYIETF